MAAKSASHSSDWPSGEDRKGVFEQYTLAVGKVTHTWNYLHEKLGQLFVVVTGAERSIALAIWYSAGSDEAQRNMLSAAVKASRKLIPRNGDFEWLFDQCNELSQRRDDAIRAPCSIYLGGTDDGSAILGVSYLYGRPQAKNLSGKKLLVEFDWCERYTEMLTIFVARVESCLSSSGDYPWPDRPQSPRPGLKERSNQRIR